MFFSELKLPDSFNENINCYFEGNTQTKDLVVTLDNQETINANRQVTRILPPEWCHAILPE